MFGMGRDGLEFKRISIGKTLREKQRYHTNAMHNTKQGQLDSEIYCHDHRTIKDLTTKFVIIIMITFFILLPLLLLLL